MNKLTLVAALMVAASLASPAMAQKDKDNPGQGRGADKADKADRGNGKNGDGDPPGAARGQANPGHGVGQGGPSTVNVVVTERDRGAIHEYYRPLYAAGNCPPGLAKKNNGCLPPSQAKKLWSIGQPLPAGMTFYPLPPALLGQLTPAPAGYQYVRVASDILMMAVGTQLIVSAIADLGTM
jgi:Ni/Co efflux regulator RcnB